MNQTSQMQRRTFLGKTVRVLTGGALMPWALETAAADSGLRNDRPQVAAIGVGWQPDIKREGRGIAIARQAARFGDVVAVCDVDRVAAEYARETVTGGKASVHEDYQEILARDDIDALIIGTPDHWHAKIAIEGLKAGKDIYCEKPLTLTIDEGKQVCQVARQTDRVFQVGTQQRSEFGQRFLTAVALVRHGRIGAVRRVVVGVDRGLTGGPFQVTTPPRHLNWDRWLGPAPHTEYIKNRCHWTFRWWFEYAGGKITDWGAHHVDIAQWAIGMEQGGPTHIEGRGTFAQPLRDGFPTRADMYNTAVEFNVVCRFANGVEMVINHESNGIRFEGERGSLFVNRRELTGKAVDELARNPLPDGAIDELCRGQRPGDHMGNFFECLKTRRQPLSDVFTHHRTLTTCHLANICLRLGRRLTWDPKAEQFVGDDEANRWLEREPRKGYEIRV